MSGCRVALETARDPVDIRKFHQWTALFERDRDFSDRRPSGGSKLRGRAQTAQLDAWRRTALPTRSRQAHSTQARTGAVVDFALIFQGESSELDMRVTTTCGTSQRSAPTSSGERNKPSGSARRSNGGSLGRGRFALYRCDRSRLQFLEGRSRRQSRDDDHVHHAACEQQQQPKPLKPCSSPTRNAPRPYEAADDATL